MARTKNRRTKRPGRDLDERLATTRMRLEQCEATIEATERALAECSSEELREKLQSKLDGNIYMLRNFRMGMKRLQSRAGRARNLQSKSKQQKNEKKKRARLARQNKKNQSTKPPVSTPSMGEKSAEVEEEIGDDDEAMFNAKFPSSPGTVPSCSGQHEEPIPQERSLIGGFNIKREPLDY